MSRPIVLIFDVTTQEEVIREMNDAEFNQHEIDKAAEEARQAEEIAALTR